MSTADHSRSEPAPAASEIAAQLCEADFVRLVTTPDGDALLQRASSLRRLQYRFRRASPETRLARVKQI
ncbi:hypothetical protein ACFQL7_14585 [Halocatena marina]|uniref:Uncharacterized protein n=1 Tax=Halocatena marina TaxID=2934937 RepID=A0ABD5YNL6_9EURY